MKIFLGVSLFFGAWVFLGYLIRSQQGKNLSFLTKSEFVLGIRHKLNAEFINNTLYFKPHFIERLKMVVTTNDNQINSFLENIYDSQIGSSQFGSATDAVRFSKIEGVALATLSKAVIMSGETGLSFESSMERVCNSLVA